MLLSRFAGAILSCLGFGLSACATTSDTVAAVPSGMPSRAAHHGGIENPVAVPAETLDCETEAQDLLETIEQRTPRFPRDLGLYLFANQSIDMRAMQMRYDIDETGHARNIRHNGDPELLENGTNRETVYRMASAIKDWRFRWDESATTRYAAGCVTQFNFQVGR